MLESLECFPPDQALAVVDDCLVEELVQSCCLRVGPASHELDEETTGLQPALVVLPAQVLPLGLAVQADPDVLTVEVRERLSRPLLGFTN